MIGYSIMSINLSVCLQVVSVQVVGVFPYSTINEMCHLLLRLVCIIVGLSWSKSAVRDKVLQQVAIHEALVVEVRCASQSPLMRADPLDP
jgi:hypothetical protein